MAFGRRRGPRHLGRRLACLLMVAAGLLNLDYIDRDEPLTLLLAVAWFGAAVFWFVFPGAMSARDDLGPKD